MSAPANDNLLNLTPEMLAEIREEADSIALEYDRVPMTELAAALERSLVAYDGGLVLIFGVISEMRRRAAAGVRTWSVPALGAPTSQAETAHK